VARGRITRTGSVPSGGASRLDAPACTVYEMLLEPGILRVEKEKLSVSTS
jgi:hypothetical protein